MCPRSACSSQEWHSLTTWLPRFSASVYVTTIPSNSTSLPLKFSAGLNNFLLLLSSVTFTINAHHVTHFTKPGIQPTVRFSVSHAQSGSTGTYAVIFGNLDRGPAKRFYSAAFPNLVRKNCHVHSHEVKQGFQWTLRGRISVLIAKDLGLCQNSHSPLQSARHVVRESLPEVDGFRNESQEWGLVQPYRQSW